MWMRSSPEGDRKALWSPPQRRNPCNKKDQQQENHVSRCWSVAPIWRDNVQVVGKAAWGASADAQSYWQGRFAACTFVGGFLGVERPKNSWGVAPNPTRELRPLTLFLRPSLSAFPQLYAFAAFFPYSQIGSCPNVGTTCVQKTSCANTTVAVLSHGWNAIRPSRFTSWSKTS